MNGLDELCQVIERNRQVADETARLAPEVREAAGSAGLWLLAAPQEVGGLELPLPELLTVIERVAEADPTVAWHAGNSVGLGMAAAALGDADRRAVAAGGDRPFGFSGRSSAAHARLAGDDYLLEGAWPFMTGSADADWALVAAVVEDDCSAGGPPPVRNVVVPLGSLQVDTNWQAAAAICPARHR